MEVEPHIKEKLIEEHRDIHVSCSYWHNDVINDFSIQLVNELGVSGKDYQFSGFWCQGDGASFEGYVHNWELFLKQFKDDEYPTLRRALNNKVSTDFCWERDREHRYVHERTCVYHTNCDGWITDHDLEMDEMLRGVHTVWNEQLEIELNAFEKAAQEIIIAKMKELYSNLEQEYEHLTSDEVVWEYVSELPTFNEMVASLREEE